MVCVGHLYPGAVLLGRVAEKGDLKSVAVSLWVQAVPKKPVEKFALII